MKQKHIGLQTFAIIWCAITIFPLYFTLLSSFKTTTQIYKAPFSLPQKVEFTNFTAAIERGFILNAIKNSFFLAAVTVILVLLVASAAAYIIARRDAKIYKAIYLYLLSGILIPVHCTFIPLVRMVSSVNGNNNYLVMTIIYVTMNLPLAFLLICGYMKGISKELEEAAIIDGYGPGLIYTKIMLPLSKPILATAGIITFLAVYNDLIFALLFVNKKELRPISLALNMFKVERSVDYGPIFAAIVLAIIPMMIVYAFLQDKIIAGMCAGAVKG